MCHNPFKLWCWRRLFRVPWTAKRSNPINPKGNQPWIVTGRAAAEVPIVWPPDVKSGLSNKERLGLSNKTLMLGKIEGKGRRGQEKVRRWETITIFTVWATREAHVTNLMGMELIKRQKTVEDRGLACCLRGVTESWTQLGNWTTAKTTYEVTGFLFAQARLSRNSCYLPTKVSQLITPKNPH